MSHYSVIWNGSESNIREQLNYVRDWAKSNHVKVLGWKHKSMQGRICNYVGNPQNASDKYTLLKMNSAQLAAFRDTVGKEFEYTELTTTYLVVADLFVQMSCPEEMEVIKARRYGNEYSVYETLEDARASFTLADNQTLELIDIAGGLRNAGVATEGRPVRYRAIVTTRKQATLQPWVVLEESELDSAIVEFNKQQGIDVETLQDKERKYISDYNRNNDLCGRKRWIPQDRRSEYQQATLDAYDARATADALLKDVRKQLGNVKRTMTKLWKSNGGIDFDLAAFAKECNLGVTVTAPKCKTTEVFEKYFEIIT